MNQRLTYFILHINKYLTFYNLLYIKILISNLKIFQGIHLFQAIAVSKSDNIFPRVNKDINFDKKIDIKNKTINK